MKKLTSKNAKKLKGGELVQRGNQVCSTATGTCAPYQIYDQLAGPLGRPNSLDLPIGAGGSSEYTEHTDTSTSTSPVEHGKSLVEKKTQAK